METTVMAPRASVAATNTRWLRISYVPSPFLDNLFPQCTTRLSSMEFWVWSHQGDPTPRGWDEGESLHNFGWDKMMISGRLIIAALVGLLSPGLQAFLCRCLLFECLPKALKIDEMRRLCLWPSSEGSSPSGGQPTPLLKAGQCHETQLWPDIGGHSFETCHAMHKRKTSFSNLNLHLGNLLFIRELGYCSTDFLLCQVKSLEVEVKKVKEHEEFYQNKVRIMTYVIVTWDTC